MEGDNLQAQCFSPTSSSEIQDFRKGCVSTSENEIIPSGALVEVAKGEMVEETKIGKGKDKESEIIMCSSGEGACAICLDEISLQEIALVKDCEHAYCVRCILKWATYSKNQTCPQCLNPFKSLQTHRSLDGSMHDYMMEESVCLLLRAAWFNKEDEDTCLYYPEEEEEEEEEMDGCYGVGSSNIRIGNRRWGDNGYVRAGRQEARPAVRDNPSLDTCKGAKKKAAGRGGGMGRRATRAMKRQAAYNVDSPPGPQ